MSQDNTEQESIEVDNKIEEEDIQVDNEADTNNNEANSFLKTCIKYNDLFANKMKDFLDSAFSSVPEHVKENSNEVLDKITIGAGVLVVIASKLK